MSQTIYQIKEQIEWASRTTLSEYEHWIDALEENHMPEAAIKELVAKAQKQYFFSVYKSVVGLYGDQTKIKIVRALDYPTFAGLPSNFDSNYFNRNGMTGGVLFAILNYALAGNIGQLTDEQVRIMKGLDQYQTDLMDGVWKKKLARYSKSQQKETSDDKPRFCRKCGRRLENGYSFCNYCGTRVNQ